jgi:hypothetical protein
MKTLCTFLAMAALATFATAQDNGALPPVALWGNHGTGSTRSHAAPAKGKRANYPTFCPPARCLYYAGDFDSTYSGANGLFDANDSGAGLEGQVWVGVKPDHDVTVTGATFAEFLTSGYMGTNPTPFAVQVGIQPGQAGKTVCSSNASATYALIGFIYEIPLYAVTIKKLPKSCKLKKDRVYYVNLLPTSTNGYGYVVNMPVYGAANPHGTNHEGWSNDYNDCYFNGPVFGSDYVTCNSQGSFSELSIALTGKERK